MCWESDIVKKSTEGKAAVFPASSYIPQVALNWGHGLLFLASNLGNKPPAMQLDSNRIANLHLFHVG